MTEFRQTLRSMLEPYLDDDLQDLLDESLTERFNMAAHMDSGLTDTALTGHIIAALNQGNLLSPSRFPALLRAEQETLTFFKDLFGFQQGHFTSGGSEANLEALWYARKAKPERRLVYGTAACHYSVHKACDMLGLQFQVIESTYEVMDKNMLEKACQNTPPLAVILNAGTTSAGMLDPLEAAIDISRDSGAYCHIDAAWGGFLALDGELPRAVQMADSLSFDPHKSLSQPKPCGLLLYQQLPAGADQLGGPYLDSEPAIKLSGSAGGERFLSLWLTLRQDNGRQLQQHVHEQISQAKLFRDWLIAQKYPCIAGPAAVVCFQLPEPATRQIIASGQFSTTTIDGTDWCRAVFSRPEIKAEELIRAVAAAL